MNGLLCHSNGRRSGFILQSAASRPNLYICRLHLEPSLPFPLCKTLDPALETANTSLVLLSFLLSVLEVCHPISSSPSPTLAGASLEVQAALHAQSNHRFPFSINHHSILSSLEAVPLFSITVILFKPTPSYRQLQTPHRVSALLSLTILDTLPFPSPSFKFSSHLSSPLSSSFTTPTHIKPSRRHLRHHSRFAPSLVCDIVTSTTSTRKQVSPSVYPPAPIST